MGDCMAVSVDHLSRYLYCHVGPALITTFFQVTFLSFDAFRNAVFHSTFVTIFTNFISTENNIFRVWKVKVNKVIIHTGQIQRALSQPRRFNVRRVKKLS